MKKKKFNLIHGISREIFMIEKRKRLIILNVVKYENLASVCVRYASTDIDKERERKKIHAIGKHGGKKRYVM